jgi:hypothetical protein
MYSWKEYIRLLKLLLGYSLVTRYTHAGVKGRAYSYLASLSPEKQYFWDEGDACIVSYQHALFSLYELVRL